MCEYHHDAASAVSSNEIDGHVGCDNQLPLAIKECDRDIASTNSKISVVVPGVHLTLERGAVHSLPIIAAVPRATSTENSGQMERVNHHTYAAAQE